MKAYIGQDEWYPVADLQLMNNWLTDKEIEIDKELYDEFREAEARFIKINNKLIGIYYQGEW